MRLRSSLYSTSSSVPSRQAKRSAAPRGFPNKLKPAVARGGMTQRLSSAIKEARAAGVRTEVARNLAYEAAAHAVRSEPRLHDLRYAQHEQGDLGGALRRR